jgi:hypothetical protein
MENSVAKNEPVVEVGGVRQVERGYLSDLGRLVDRGSWLAICRKAIEQAKEGDYRARDWISRWVMPKDVTLLDIASDEARGRTVGKIIKSHLPPVSIRTVP